MKINPTTAIAGLRSKWQPLLAGILGLTVLLELGFSFFDIVPGPITVFDLQGISVIVIFVCARPKLFQSTFWLTFKRLPVIYQISFFIAMYIVVVKAAYFAGYLFGMIKGNCF